MQRIMINGEEWTIRHRHVTETTLRRRHRAINKALIRERITVEQAKHAHKALVTDALMLGAHSPYAAYSSVAAVTFVEVVMPGGSKVDGIAVCSVRDRFNPRRGFREALDRALRGGESKARGGKYLVSGPVIGQLWDAMNTAAARKERGKLKRLCLKTIHAIERDEALEAPLKA